MTTRLLCAVVVGGICALSHGASAQDKPGAAMILSIKVLEEAGGSKVRILAEPTIAITIGRPFSFESGGRVKPRSGDGEVEFGTRVSGKIVGTRADAVQITLRIGIGSAVSQPDDPETDLVRTETLEIRTVSRIGESKHLDCSRGLRCEVNVAAAK